MAQGLQVFDAEGNSFSNDFSGIINIVPVSENYYSGSSCGGDMSENYIFTWYSGGEITINSKTETWERAVYSDKRTLAIIRFDGLNAMCRLEYVGENLSWVNAVTGNVFCEDGDGVIIRFLDEMERSTDWKERLYAEYWQAKIRLKKLKPYINKRIDGLSTEKEPIEILLMQENYMQGYLRCLEANARYNACVCIPFHQA